MSLNELKRTVQELILPILEAKRAFLVDVQVRGEQGVKIIQAFVDTDSGITIAECADISRELNKVLGLSQIIEGAYNLEVSSPGIDKPLKLLRQYFKNIGRTYKVRYGKDSEEFSLIGTLTDVTDDCLTFSPEQGEPLTLMFSQIIESKEELPW